MKTYLNNLPPFEKRVVVVVGIILFIVLNALFVFPRFNDWGAMQSRRYEAEQKLERYEKKIAQATSYERKVRELESEGLSVPPEEQSIQFSRAIQTEQARSGVNITATGKMTTRTNQFFLEQSQLVSVSSGEKQLVDFLYNLGAGNSLIRVRDLSLRPDPPRQQLSSSVKLVASFQKKTTIRPPTAARADAVRAPAGSSGSAATTAQRP
jgi:type II secretory pathway component PulM